MEDRGTEEDREGVTDGQLLGWMEDMWTDGQRVDRYRRMEGQADRWRDRQPDGGRGRGGGMYCWLRLISLI